MLKADCNPHQLWLKGRERQRQHHREREMMKRDLNQWGKTKSKLKKSILCKNDRVYIAFQNKDKGRNRRNYTQS